MVRRAAFVYNTSRDGVKTCGLESYVDPSSACRRIELIPLISANDFAIVHPRVSVSIVKGPRRSKLVYIQMRLLYIAPISSLSLSLSLSITRFQTNSSPVIFYSSRMPSQLAPPIFLDGRGSARE